MVLYLTTHEYKVGTLHVRRTIAPCEKGNATWEIRTSGSIGEFGDKHYTETETWRYASPKQERRWEELHRGTDASAFPAISQRIFTRRRSAPGYTSSDRSMYRYTRMLDHLGIKYRVATDPSGICEFVVIRYADA